MMTVLRFMPRFIDHLHYRIVDVSTIKELARYSDCCCRHRCCCC